MCFCAGASFTVGSVLAATGGVTMAKVPHKALLALAAIPILFAIQQFLEGIIWLQVQGQVHAPGDFAVFVYVVFAWVLWPVFIPIALLLPEKVRWRRIACLTALIIGAIVACDNLWYLFHNKVDVKVLAHSLNYGEETSMSNSIIYLLAILIATLASSLKRIWLFGGLVLVSFVLARMIYNVTFTSVWCFFAAAISLVLYEVLCSANADYQRE